MIEVSNRLYVGNQDDYEWGIRNYNGWAIVHACKDPYHRQFVGYASRGCPKGIPEYLYAVRGNEIALNMVDVDIPEFFDKTMISMAIGFIANYALDEKEDWRILIHCNQGESRSPSIAMLYLAIDKQIPNRSFEEAEKAFKQKYPYYNPKHGIREHLRKNWNSYIYGDDTVSIQY